MKAQQAYRDANSGLPLNIPNDIFKPSDPETKDELSIFSGKTHTLTAKSKTTIATNAAGNTPPSSNKIRSISDSPPLDNPSFEGAHPSLVSELNVFNGLIKSQTENAYKAGGEVFGGGPMVVDGGSRGQGSGGRIHQHQPTQLHMARQQSHEQQHQPPQQPTMYQPDYQRQHFNKQEAERLEREREEVANRELERQEMERQEVERQELARQQQLHQQQEIQRQQAHEQEAQRRQQQQEMIQRQQQLDIRRQQEKQQQQQMQDQYLQQMEIQQRQLQQRQQQAVPQHYSYNDDQTQMLIEPDGGMMVSSASSSHHAATVLPTHKHLPHSQSQPNIHQAYQQHQQYQPIHHADTTVLPPLHVPSQPVQRVMQHAQQRHSFVAQQPQHQQQHSMYLASPEYPQYPTPDSSQACISPVYHVPPTPVSATSSTSSYIPYWPAASNSFAMPNQQPISRPSTSGYSDGSISTAPPRMQIPEHHHQHQHYTPEGALRGIAADDRSLQETWQSYMNKVYSFVFYGHFWGRMLTHLFL